jgi:hypothetical protein
MTMPHMFQRYLIASSILWGSVGAAHGYTLYKLNKGRPDPELRYIAGGALYGLFLGPWAPIAGPIWLAKKWPMSTCTHLKY